ncbi:MAG: hydrogenase [Desulfoprunum sp.]|jgi:Ni,Fe-hydrogenase III large subunit|uniref:hydrogenase large subunit n=1 Tax=Desulfoprunum sp. TaxID=2020866 RepID=UPI00052D35E3|nr:hydrogenase [Desulfobulbus sp. Tol-SR]
MDNLLQIANGEVVRRADIPDVSVETFGMTLAEFVKNGGFVVQFFAFAESEVTRLLAVVRNDKLFVTSCEVGAEFPSLTGWVSEKFHLFEREIAEQYGIRPTAHPWLKMVRYHPNYSGAADVFGNDYAKDEIPGKYDCFKVEGEAIHEVAVGPVHAGIIEPGHFRFQCAGEEVLHLEIQLGYQHRGVEQLLPTVPQRRLPIICEAIAGDTAIGHNLCCCQALEALAGLTVDAGARVVRTIALELERIANHLGDLGALSGDVAFNPPAAYFGRMRGDFLNLLQVLCGNRFGKGLVRPGGVAFVMGEEQRQLIAAKLHEITPQVKNVCDLLFSAHTVQARFENTGIVSREMAEDLGLVGYAGRACGLAYDARVVFPTECYPELPHNTNQMTSGDVYSRATVRREEIMHSIALIELLLKRPETTAKAVMMEERRLAADSLVVTINEGWRGEVSHSVLTGPDGTIVRYKVKDPSFHNWTGLAMSLRNQGISDFPLCNKSYNLSYCGFDL